MKNIFAFTFLTLFQSLLFSQNIPVTKSIPKSITKFETTYQDNYSWLEKMESEETKNWINAQNEAINLHLNEIKKEYDILRKLKEYNTYSSSALPTKKESYYYSIYLKDKDKPSNLFYRKNLNDIAIEIFNLFKIYKSESVVLTDYNPSKNSKYLACKVSLNGSDKNEIRFVDIEKNKNLDDVINNVKLSKMAWNQDFGIFYKKNSNQSTFAKDSTYQLYYHKLGTEQQKDKLIFDASNTLNSFSYFTKKDRLIIIEQDHQTEVKNYYYSFLNEDDFKVEKFIDSDNSKFTFLNYNNNVVYFSTKEYDWGEIRTFNISDRKNEKVIIPQIYNNLLVDSYFYEDYIFVNIKLLANTTLLYTMKMEILLGKLILQRIPISILNFSTLKLNVYI